MIHWLFDRSGQTRGLVYKLSDLITQQRHAGFGVVHARVGVGELLRKRAHLPRENLILLLQARGHLGLLEHGGCEVLHVDAEPLQELLGLSGLGCFGHSSTRADCA